MPTQRMHIRTFLIALFIVTGDSTQICAVEPIPAQFVQVAKGFSRPVWLGQAPGNPERMFILEQHTGLVRILDLTTNKIANEPFLSLPEVTKASEQGLLGMAFHPQYQTNGLVFINATIPGNGKAGRTVILCYKAIGDPKSATRVDPQSRTEILAIDQPEWNHNGVWLAFGPDGFLWIGTGDGGGGGDHHGNIGNGQDRTSMLGKMLRIDIDRGSPYSLPTNNMMHDGKLTPIVAFGLRNPWRCDFDSETGDLWIGDVGQNLWEEIDVLPAGAIGLNFGWRVREGFHPYGKGNQQPVTPVTDPIYEMARADAHSITGGCLYRGSAIPSLRGTYICADYWSGRFWSMRYDRTTGKATDAQECTAQVKGASRLGAISTFGKDLAGEIYLCDLSGGSLWKLMPLVGATTTVARDWTASLRVPANGPKGAPALLSQTSAFVDTAALKPAAALTAYEVNAPFWSDGTSKRRWLAMPRTGKVTFSVNEPWIFPAGTVAVKHFDWTPDERQPHTTKRLETRLLVANDSGGVYGVTYRWRDDQSDADVVMAATTTPLTITKADGSERTQTWFFPGPADCLQCHIPQAGHFLGLSSKQLNRKQGDGTNQIEALTKSAVFSNPPAQETQAHLPRLASPTDTARTLEDRARAYLDTNCAFCHRPGGTPMNFDLRWDVPLAQQRIVNAPVIQAFGIDPVHLITPGDPEHSLIWRRAHTTDEKLRMPSMARMTIDEFGTDLLAQWISSLKH